MQEPTVERVKCRVLPDGRMPSDDAGSYIGRSTQTLANWRVKGYGPRWVKIGGRVYYYQQELDAFIRGEAA